MMRMAIVAALTLGLPIAYAATVSLDQTSLHVAEGDAFQFVTMVRNDGQDAWARLSVTLNVVRLADGLSEDPEDWDPDWSYHFENVQPGQQVMVTWNIRTIKAGDFAFYAGAWVHGEATPSVSDVLLVAIDARPAVDPARMLPVVLGVPGVVAFVFGVRARAYLQRKAGWKEMARVD